MTDFIERGRLAYRRGESRAPALCPEVADAIRYNAVGDPETRRIMTDFIKGFEQESIKGFEALHGPESNWSVPRK